ncbi:hypothetical protein [Sphaerisporangium album]|uniref:hypothetical protein n=1 Tax=Sphaerisporangium album TaxID=509200 RepID=UPI0011C083C4|nr:hypothetical protein [Sphaerisporangium album]
MTITPALRVPIRRLAVPLALALGLLLQPVTASSASAARKPPPATTQTGVGAGHVQRAPLPVADRPPVPAAKDALRRDPGRATAAAPEHPRPSMARASAGTTAAGADCPPAPETTPTCTSASRP